MSFVEEWKEAKGRYERAVKDKKPSATWLGHLRKPTGIEAACKDLDTAIAKQDKVKGEKALAAIKKAGESYLATLEKAIQTESQALKQMKTVTLKKSLEDMLLDAHNAIKGLDLGVFDQVLGPDIMTRVLNLKFPKDAYIKGFATNAQFTQSHTARAVSPELVNIQKDYVSHYNVCLSAHRTFVNNKGKTMQKAQALKIAKITLDEMFNHSGRDGMLGSLAAWQKQQIKETNGNKQAMDSFTKSTGHQFSEQVGKALNDDAVKLNAAKEKLKAIKI